MKIIILLILIVMFTGNVLPAKSKTDNKKRKIFKNEKKYYSKDILVFENFESDSLIAKFKVNSKNLVNKHFIIESNKNGKFGKWGIKKQTQDWHAIKTCIRIPNLEEFAGISFNIKTSGFKYEDFEIIIIEGKRGKRSKKDVWRISIPNITDKWKVFKLPFKDFHPDKDDRSMDLTIIGEIVMRVNTSEEGYIGIDNIEFYK